MMKRTVLASASALVAFGASYPLAAQDAAETAIILSGSGSGQAKASQSLGDAISRSIGGATAAINARPNARAKGRTAAQQRARGPIQIQSAIPADVDPLEGTDAAAYKLGSGATIRVSGRLNPSAGTVCIKECEQEQPEHQPEE